MRLPISQNRLPISEHRLYIPLTPNEGYDPANSAYIWWDGSDSSAMDLNGSNEVLKLYDKGRCSLDLTPNASSPIYNQTQQNGLPTVTFDGDFLQTPVSNFTIDNCIVLIAFKPLFVDNTYTSVLSLVHDTDPDFQIQSNNSSEWRGSFNSTFGQQSFATTNSMGTPQLLSFTNVVADGEILGYKNGQQVLTLGSFNGWATTDVYFNVGANRAGNRLLGMDFYEIIAESIDNASDATEYMMNKWGITQ